MPRRYEFTNEQWEQIKDFFPPYSTGRPPKRNNREMFNAILWIARSGAPWRDEGVLLTIFQELNAELDFENLSIDSTNNKAHQHSAGAKKVINHKFHQCIDMSSVGRTTKIHTIADGLGNPILFHLTGENIFDSTPYFQNFGLNTN